MFKGKGLAPAGFDLNIIFSMEAICTSILGVFINEGVSRILLTANCRPVDRDSLFLRVILQNYGVLLMLLIYLKCFVVDQSHSFFKYDNIFWMDQKRTG